MLRRDARHSVWCWRMPSSIPKRTISTFGNAVAHKALFRHNLAGVLREELCAASSSENVWTTSESGNDLLRGETQTFLPRSRPQSEFTDPPSIAPRPRLQPVSPQASPRCRGSQQSYFISL